MAPIKTNNPYASYFDFFSRSGTDAVTPAPIPSGLTATGGIISDYEDSGTYYRAHVFTSSGALNVTALGNIASTVEYLVVAGGGGCSYHRSGGGGAGGFRTNVPGVQNAAGSPLTGAAFPVSVSPYTITVGAGGAGNLDPYTGGQGGESFIGPPGSKLVPAAGGGFAKGAATGTSGSGGSGGGNDWNNYGSAGAGNTPPTSPPQGNPGGNAGAANSVCGQGGGGGAGATGSNGTVPTGGAGGVGVSVAIESSSAKYYAGGGGGGADDGKTAGAGGNGGGGTGSAPGIGNSGVVGTGGGGGGAG